MTNIPFKGNIERETLKNTYYRRILHTNSMQQLVVMKILPKQEIGMELHPKTSQFIRVEHGKAMVVINSKKYILKDGDVVVIPPGTMHNVINIENRKSLKLYSIYSPPEHPSGTKQKHKPSTPH